MNRVRNVIVVLMTALTLSGCGCMKKKLPELRSVLEKELKAGDTSGRVEEVLKNAGVVYSYDEYQNRYQGNVYDSQCGPYEGISVYVYLDDSKKMTEFEAFVSYTSL